MIKQTKKKPPKNKQKQNNNEKNKKTKNNNSNNNNNNKKEQTNKKTKKQTFPRSHQNNYTLSYENIPPINIICLKKLPAGSGRGSIAPRL